MGRQYSRSDFERAIETVKDQLDRPALTADIIVGFPGETDQEFKDTADLAMLAGFSKMHLFAFSARQGTAAAQMPHPIPGTVVRERTEHLRLLGRKLAHQYRGQFLGEQATVLIEEAQGTLYSGLCERYFTVYVPRGKKKFKRNDLIAVTLKAPHDNGLISTPGEPTPHA
jgi:threonylcarbamoyladenosine tRNA methylthiotransferase MtaB